MKNKNKLELLCPAKNAETGIAAINHGADAIYIGYKSFGAREAAGNSIADIERLIEYAHLFHARVYITLNTILYNNELDKVERLIHQLYNIGADAIIIQDMGIMEMNLPPIPIHASTQTNNVTPEKVRFLQDIGIQRVILARELSLAEISTIRQHTSVELEAFIHGALCVSYSGQCYMSYAMTQRSANRGECAQPCRLKYSLVDNQGNTLVQNKHLLSLKDFNQTENIGSLIDAGITSLKIEGRLKDISYVKNITAHYRQIIDAALEQRPDLKKSSSGKCVYNFIPDPERTFNRGYTNYFTHGRAKNMASINTPKSIGKLVGSVTQNYKDYLSADMYNPIHNNDGLCFFDKDNRAIGFKVNNVDSNKIYPNQPLQIKPNTEIYRNYDHKFSQLLQQNNSATRKIECSLNLKIGQCNITLTLTDEDNISSSFTCTNSFEVAQNSDGMLNIIRNQLGKTGNTAYQINKINITNSTPLMPFVAAATVNHWRRELLEIHSWQRKQQHKIVQIKITPNSAPYPEQDVNFKTNITNSLAKQFYLRHGVQKIDEGFELKNLPQGQTVMTTKYCILYELGLCDGKSKKVKKQLFLKDDKRTYPIHFNCGECQMQVKFPNEQ